MDKTFKTIIFSTILALTFGLVIGIVLSVNAQEYIDNELIVKFDTNYDPVELDEYFAGNETFDNTLIGKIKEIVTSVLHTFNEDSVKEESWIRIRDVERKVGMTSMHYYYDNDQDKVTTYKVVLDGTMSVEDAVREYESLDEVDYAQPHYLYEVSIR